MPQDLSLLSLPGLCSKELAHRSSHKGHLTAVGSWLCPGPVHAVFLYSGTCILSRWESLCPSFTDTQQMANTDSIHQWPFGADPDLGAGWTLLGIAPCVVAEDAHHSDTQPGLGTSYS